MAGPLPLSCGVTWALGQGHPAPCSNIQWNESTIPRRQAVLAWWRILLVDMVNKALKVVPELRVNKGTGLP